MRDGNVRLEELAERHLEGLAELGRDPEVQRYTYVPSPWLEGFERTWLERYDQGDGTRAGFAVVDGSRLQASERITIDRSLPALPRVGVTFELPVEFGELAWLGLGPGDSYPDRRAAVRVGRWEATVGELVVPFVRPQEYGLHLDTNWLELASPSLALRVHGDRPLAFSALPHSVAELEAATHAHLLPPSTATHVHIDVAHRGLGTAACGPDTHPRHLVRGGTHRFTWTLSASTP